MATKVVNFEFVTGLRRQIFSNARLYGSWDTNGRYSEQWTETPMAKAVGEDGCPIFTATFQFDCINTSQTFKWGVILDGPQGANFWGIPTEIQDANSTDRYRQFCLDPTNGESRIERYYFTYGRFLGANKVYRIDDADPGLRFAVWAPNARDVQVVFGDSNRGYISDAGDGIDKTIQPIQLQLLDRGIWVSPRLQNFAKYEGSPYMYRIVNAQGNPVYRTDIFSRSQFGRGDVDPAQGANWLGTISSLDGSKGCSCIVDPDTVNKDFMPSAKAVPVRISVENFWAQEFTTGLPVPKRVEDLVIYELHVGALGFGKPLPGDLSDALAFLDHLVTLGVNAVELLPMAEFSGNISWGYGDTHYCVIQTSAGGRDEYKHFVRACHQRGLAVIQDVVYNHYDNNALRAEWQYDSITPEQNIYYWYEGTSSAYEDPGNGYLNNGSSGFTPRFWEEMVRQQFISSATFLVEEMHIDGLRVDLTQAMHRDNRLNTKDGPSVSSANIFGQKLLREWSRTLQMIQPSIMLIAEDHSGWDAVTKPLIAGGLGFDATWYAAFYHNLIGADDAAGGMARLLKNAGTGGNEPLDFAQFSAALYATGGNKVVYHESHDEAGNASGSARTMMVAVNSAPIWGATRVAAEARSRVVFGLSLFSAGTPMFFMAEEIAAQKPYRYNDFLANREDILGESTRLGAPMFRYYQDLITLSRRLNSIRSHNIDILHQSGSNRVIIFKRWEESEEVLVFVSLNNIPFENGYVVQSELSRLPNAWWKEVFNSDATIYGGNNIGNAGATIASRDGQLTIKLPASGFLVFVKQQ